MKRNLLIRKYLALPACKKLAPMDKGFISILWWFVLNVEERLIFPYPDVSEQLIEAVEFVLDNELHGVLFYFIMYRDVQGSTSQHGADSARKPLSRDAGGRLPLRQAQCSAKQ